MSKRPASHSVNSSISALITSRNSPSVMMMNGIERNVHDRRHERVDDAQDQRHEEQRQSLSLNSSGPAGAGEADAVEEPGGHGERDGVGEQPAMN